MNLEELKLKIAKNAGVLMLIACVLGLLPNLLAFLPLSNSVADMLLSVNGALAPSVYFSIPDSYFYIGFNEASGLSYNYISILFYGIGIYGYALFKQSEGKKTILVLFFFTVIFFGEVIGLVFFVLNSLLDFGYLSSFRLSWIFGILMSVVWPFIAYHIIKSLSLVTAAKEREDSLHLLDDVYKTKPETELKDYSATPNGERLLHHIVDSLLILTLCAEPVWYLFMMYFFDFSYGEFGTFGLSLYLLVGRFLYYPLLETLFGTTPGKIMTNSIVLKSNNTKLTLADGFKRTLSRIVPFEPLSFLGSKPGWHDTWTKTKVVKRESNPQDYSDLKSNDII